MDHPTLKQQCQLSVLRPRQRLHQEGASAVTRAPSVDGMTLRLLQNWKHTVQSALTLNTDFITIFIAF